jgi:ribosome-binding factor A
MPSYRMEQIGHQIQIELSELLLREVRDPRLGFVTITQVNVASDLSIARVNISCFGDETEQQESLRALKHAAGFLRTAVSKRIRMRTMPQLIFHLDHSMAHAEEVQRTLKSLEPELAAAKAREEAEAALAKVAKAEE